MLKTMAAVLGLGYDDFKQRDKERAQQRLRIILASVLVLFIVFMGLAVTLYLGRRTAMDIGSEAKVEAARHKNALITVQRQLNESETALSEANEEKERLRRELKNSQPPDASTAPR